ncbi:MAG: GNAT family N-acetyltransferase, partial [Armatimonadota bacterium]
GKLAGFITVFTDGFYIAYIPLLEVRPELQRRGIGKALVRAAVERYRDFYKLDVLCDLRSVLFYQQLGFKWVSGATLVNYDRQSTGRE